MDPVAGIVGLAGGIDAFPMGSWLGQGRSFQCFKLCEVAASLPLLGTGPRLDCPALGRFSLIRGGESELGLDSLLVVTLCSTGLIFNMR
mmetsp:Transcript_12485/g.25384  ORF Transcript_12485/g.25384 Transcript_12485/m.25384 type:complete len:89 (+) Transcript_12485:3355-3621(+)